MSFEVTCRLSGGPNFTPGRILNVYVFPPFVGEGTAVAMSATILFPGAPARWVYPTSVRTRRFEYMLNASPRYSPVGSKPSVKPKSDSQPTR